MTLDTWLPGQIVFMGQMGLDARMMHNVMFLGTETRRHVRAGALGDAGHLAARAGRVHGREGAGCKDPSTMCSGGLTRAGMCAQVRSVTLDTWLPGQVAFMGATGNAAANAHYEAKLDPARKPSYYSPDLDAFIRRKVALHLRISNLML